MSDYTPIPEMEGVRKAIEGLRAENSRDNMIRVLEAIRIAMMKDGMFLVPAKPQTNALETKAADRQFGLLTVSTKDGKNWQPVFTSGAEVKTAPPAMLTVPIKGLLKQFEKDDGPAKELAGLLVNFQTQVFPLSTELIRAILKAQDDAEKRANVPVQVQVVRGDIHDMPVDCVAVAMDTPLYEDSDEQYGILYPDGIKAKAALWTVVPPNKGTVEDRSVLSAAYARVLSLMKQNGWTSIALTNFGAEAGWAVKDAAETAFFAVAWWAGKNKDYRCRIYFCVEEGEEEAVFNQLVQGIQENAAAREAGAAAQADPSSANA